MFANQPGTFGFIPPLVTPLLSPQLVDEAAVRALTDRAFQAGASAVLVLGSTGEGPHLQAQARQQVIRSAVSAANGRPVIAAVPALMTEDATRMAENARADGAAAVLAPPPFGFALSPRELAQHLRAIRTAAERPVIAYEVPSRAPSSFSAEVIGDLAREGVVSGIKDSSPDLQRLRDFQAATADLPAFDLMSGAETDLTEVVAAGATVFVPGLANVVPHAHADAAQAATTGQRARLSDIDQFLSWATSIYFVSDQGADPTARAIGALKQALVQQGIIAGDVLTSVFTRQDNTADHVRRWLTELPQRWAGVQASQG